MSAYDAIDERIRNGRVSMTLMPGEDGTEDESPYTTYTGRLKITDDCWVHALDDGFVIPMHRVLEIEWT